MSDLTLPPLPGYTPGGPAVLCILDGVGLGRRDGGDAVYTAATPTLDRLLREAPSCRVRAHGTAVGLPSDGDMGNSEVGHNALGAGRVFEQGAALVNRAIASGRAFGETWSWLLGGRTLHLIGLLSDGNVHSHVDHTHHLLRRAAADGVRRLRLHLLTDGRDVEARSVLRWLAPLEEVLTLHRAAGRDYRVASGGGRMRITMDRYEADWDMVKRGWDCHVHGLGRRFASATEAIEALYAEDPEVNDQWLPAFVIVGPDGEPVGRIRSGDSVLLTNFRGDRALEISRAFEGRELPFDRGEAPAVRYAGMMQYDGDLHIPARFLVAPPEIDRTVGAYLVANGRRSFAVSETQKFGHVTYFFNGNRSGYLDETLERYVEIPSDKLPFEQAPAMKAREITAAAVAAIRSGRWDHVRLNIANGDMVGHTGVFDAVVRAMEVVDGCVAELEAAVREVGGVMIVTADHGNAEEMYEVDKRTGDYKLGPDGRRVIRTSHSLNPVPFILVDPRGRWALRPVEGAGLASVGASVLALCGLEPPADFEPVLVAPAGA